MKFLRLSLLIVVLVSALTASKAFAGKEKGGILMRKSSISASACDYVYTCNNGSNGDCCTGLADCCATCNTACKGTCGGLC